MRRNYWLLREEKEDKDSEEKEEAKRARKMEQQKRAREEKIRKYEEKQFDKPTKERVTYTGEAIDRKIREIVEKRSGKKAALAREKRGGIDEDLDLLQDFLNESAKDNSRKLEILMILLPTRVDYSKTINSAYMIRLLWTESLKNLQELFRLIKTKDRINLAEIRNFQKEVDPYYKESTLVDSFSTHFESLDNELYKGFKALESNDPVILICV